jgi:hypothetical protein
MDPVVSIIRAQGNQFTTNICTLTKILKQSLVNEINAPKVYHNTGKEHYIHPQYDAVEKKPIVTFSVPQRYDGWAIGSFAITKYEEDFIIDFGAWSGGSAGDIRDLQLTRV